MCTELISSLDRYDFDPKTDILTIEVEPDRIMQTLAEIEKRISKSTENFLVLFIFACCCTRRDGQLEIIAYSLESSSVQELSIESRIQAFSESNPNVYTVSFYPFCIPSSTCQVSVRATDCQGSKKSKVEAT